MTQSEALEILKSGKNVFLTGEPGSGKTHTIGLFTEWLREQGREYAVTASTGIAATHINGTTIHSWAGIGIKRETKNIDVNRFHEIMVKNIQRAKTLIIDEVSMLDATTIDLVDFVLRELRAGWGAFGDIQIVFVGDFFQLPPVVTDSTKTFFAFESDAWKKAAPVTCYLTEQHRQSDQVFLEILSSMRNGTTTPNHRKILMEKVIAASKDATILYTHNVDVDRVNDDELAKLGGETRTNRASVSGIPFLVERLMKSCLSPEMLRLKVGARVMFTKNNFDVGYVNGTIGVVTRFRNGNPVVLTSWGEEIYPEPERWTFEEYGITKASFTQIPLRLAWAITVHKSQGMSLDEAVVDLSKAFEYGQGYVAISRVRSLSGLTLTGLNDKTFMMHPKVIEQDKIFRA